MGLLPVSELYLKFANVQDGEKIIGILAREGEEFNLSGLALKVRVVLFMENGVDIGDGDDSGGITIQRCGWMEKPKPDTEPGVHDSPVGRLWVVYTEDVVLGLHLASDEFAAKIEAEKAATGVARADVIQLLSHDTTTTRRRFAALLRQRAELIENEANEDTPLESRLRARRASKASLPNGPSTEPSWGPDR